MVRLYDTTNPGQSINIGSPNESCSLYVGPGSGEGGEPRLPDGLLNPFENCPTSTTNTAFTVQGPGDGFSGCNSPFTIKFEFKYPVNLNKIGLLDVDGEQSVKVVVRLIDGTVMEFWAQDGGPNSSQKMSFQGVKRVESMEVTFESGGAVQFIDYCHNCGDEAAIRKKLLDGYYPMAADRDTENSDSVAYFETLVSDLSAAIGTKLGQAVNDKYRHTVGHCLYTENVGVNAVVTVSTPIETARVCEDGASSSSVCVPSTLVSTEEFNSNENDGWTNYRYNKKSGFGGMLGRYGKKHMGNFPSKTYTVPRDADEILLEFDLLVIDGWDADQGDSVAVAIDGTVVDLGTFSEDIDQGDRVGSSVGISFSLKRKGKRARIGFDSASTDQVHRVSLRIPNSFFELDGEITVEFRFKLTNGLRTESIGFDNIDVAALQRCDTSSCTPPKVISFEDFENGETTGWAHGRTSKSAGFTQFLGRYGKDDGTKYPSKTFSSIPTDAKEIVLEFSFLEIDTWDDFSDTFRVKVDDQVVSLGKFDSGKNEDRRTGKSHGVSFRIDSEGPPTNINYKVFSDQIHHVTMTIPPTYFAQDGELQITFQAIVNENLENESAGYDNVKLTAMYECEDRRALGDKTIE